MRPKMPSFAHTALEKAQDLIYDAWEAPTAKRRVALAKKALALSASCADAYVLLAEHSPPDSAERIELWQHGVAAGEKALGKSAFKELAGHFWGFLETRPYMRARFGLAYALWKRGDRDDAIGHLRAMLALNPDDNQGVRYALAAWLAEAGQDADLGNLLAQYPDEYSAVWSWTAVLLAFRRSGDCPETAKCVADAMEVNSHVRAYLCSDTAMPRRLPPFLSPGEPDEAVHYVAEHRAGWERTPGAVAWLRTREPVTDRPVRTRRRAKRRD